MADDPDWEPGQAGPSKKKEKPAGPLIEHTERHKMSLISHTYREKRRLQYIFQQITDEMMFEHLSASGDTDITLIYNLSGQSF